MSHTYGCYTSRRYPLLACLNDMQNFMHARTRRRAAFELRKKQRGSYFPDLIYGQDDVVARRRLYAVTTQTREVGQADEEDATARTYGISLPVTLHSAPSTPAPSSYPRRRIASDSCRLSRVNTCLPVRWNTDVARTLSGRITASHDVQCPFVSTQMRLNAFGMNTLLFEQRFRCGLVDPVRLQ